MTAKPTPDSPVPVPGDPGAEQAGSLEPAQPADAPEESQEPAWIEVGSPKRRTMPPAWSDEAMGDAWQTHRTPEEPPTRTSPARIELMDQDEQTAGAPTASADEAESATDDAEPAADGHAPMASADDAAPVAEEAAPAAEGPGSVAAAVPPAAEGTAIGQGSPALRGIRLRKPPRVTHNRPFRRPAVRDSARSADREAAETGVREHRAQEEPTGVPPHAPTPAPETAPDRTEHGDPWVQGPMDEATAAEARKEPAARDPESGERWTVVPDPSGAESDPAGSDRPETDAVPADAAPAGAEPAPTAPDRAEPDQAEPAPTGPSPTAPSPTAPSPTDPSPTAHADGTPEPAAREPDRPDPVAAPQDGEHAAPQDGEHAEQVAASTGRRESAGTLTGALDVVAPHLRPHRTALILGLAALVLSIWTLVALPFPLKYSVDAAMAAAGAEMPSLPGDGSEPVVSLLTAAGVLAALVALQAGSRVLSVASLNRAGGRVATDLRSRLLSHLHRLSPGRDIDDLDRSAPPLVDDVARLRDLVAHTGPRLAASLLALASLLVVVLVVEPIAALIVLATGGLYALAARIAMRRLRTKQAAATADEAGLAETADELLAATRTIQSYGLEERAGRGLAEVGSRAERSRSAARRTEALGGFVAELIAGAGVALALLVGGWRMSAGTMSPGELTLVIAYVLIAVVLVREAVRHTAALRATVASGDRVGELLAHRAAITEPGRSQPIDRVRGEIVYSAISAPGPHGPLLDSVSLVIPAGQHVALLDREGLETSALLSYLLRFDQPETGRVLLDRYDTRAVPLSDLRRQLAVVQREPALLTGTVRENIRVGRPGATADEIVDAARRSGADEFITLLPEGYDTPLVRRGAGLTDGQRRRIAITRALLRDAPVVVLDRADADIAPGERDAVRRALAALVVGRTALISSRDPENILSTNRVLCFEGGDLAEDGAPRELAEDPDSWLSARLHAADDTGR